MCVCLRAGVRACVFVFLFVCVGACALIPLNTKDHGVAQSFFGLCPHLEEERPLVDAVDGGFEADVARGPEGAGSVAPQT